ncbi:MAG: twin-arginine translocation signal domain-containing protein [Planctomycetota bacterium]
MNDRRTFLKTAAMATATAIAETSLGRLPRSITLPLLGRSASRTAGWWPSPATRAPTSTRGCSASRATTRARSSTARTV